MAKISEEDSDRTWHSMFLSESEDDYYKQFHFERESKKKGFE